MFAGSYIYIIDDEGNLLWLALFEIPFEQIRNWVRTESAKGRPMKEIVAELATHNDVTVLSVRDSPQTRHQKIIDSIKNAGWLKQSSTLTSPALFLQ